ncbi:UNKNOWN [Stylonychia lemnae]|uniref:Uncharacterized protein n=1 Tax=Stylonychia lemnae TaxID=5949 RepID=A0A078B7L1_STYLE|nr:UNKNOWN [Stylonychia lemnae]|eukprot:CDW89538.1 UNKNOWN [Stylonychia lemnae]
MQNYFNMMIIMQIFMSITYSLVYIIVIMKAFRRFETQSLDTEEHDDDDDQEERMASDIKSIVLLRCSLIIICYTIGCSCCFCTFSKFKKHQQIYEDIVFADPNTPVPSDSMNMDVSHMQHEIQLNVSNRV